ncbi:MAG: CPBP family intramembrane metalloprotease [Lachnospiraceae bacterium]|nr:CPBP family intramembrane metalloprotease [Lachnospiraceae bacterium]
MNGKKRAGWIGLCILALLVAIGVQLVGSMLVVVPYSVFAGIQAAAGGGTANDAMQSVMGDMGNMMSIALVVVGFLLLIVFVPWYYFGCGRPKITGKSAKRVFSPRTLLVVLVLAVGMNYGINCLLQLVYELAPKLLESYQELMESSGLGINAWANAAAVILAPLGEELIFRGVIFHYARKAVTGMKSPKKAFWIANCIQALLFGIYHMNLVQGIYAFAIGLVLGYLCQKYHSVIPGMLAHLIFNGISTLFNEQLYGWIPESAAWYGLIAAAGAILVLTTLLVNGSAVTENNRNVA